MFVVVDTIHTVYVHNLIRACFIIISIALQAYFKWIAATILRFGCFLFSDRIRIRDTNNLFVNRMLFVGIEQFKKMFKISSTNIDDRYMVLFQIIPFVLC